MTRPQQSWANTSRLLVLAAAVSLLIVGVSQPVHAQATIDFPWDLHFEITPRDPTSPPEDPTFLPPVEIWVWGPASIAFGAPVGSDGSTFDLSGPVPDNGQTYTIQTEILSMDLVSIDPVQLPQGDFFVDLRLSPSQPSLGELQGVLNNGDGTFQVDSFFDVFFDIELRSVAGGELTTLFNPEPIQLSMSFGTGNDPFDMGPLPEADVLWTPVWIWEEGLANDLLDPLMPGDPLWDKWISIHGHITPEPGTMMLAIIGVATVLCGYRRRVA